MQPARKLNREEIAHIELGHTAISRRTAWLLVIVFLLTILAVPVGEHISVLVQRFTSDDPAAAKAVPAIYDMRQLLPSAEQIKAADSWQDAYALLPTPREIAAFESSLEERSTLAQWLIPNVQWLLTAYGGAGNEQAITGTGEWLFYKPSIDYVTAGPFLGVDRLKQLARFTDRSADPFPAILQLHKQLARRGIKLLLVPTPGKAQVHPEQLARSYESDADLLQNQSYAEFLDRLDTAGVAVFDPGPLLIERKRMGEEQYLATDTHWTPDAMAASAAAIAAQLKNLLPQGDSSRFQRDSRQISNLGDVAVMLKLPSWQRMYAPQQVTISPVKVEGRPWAPQSRAPVLLLGDSFSNIYSQSELGWGQGAGFAEQLGFALGLPVDRIVINAGGAHATRQRLTADLTRNPNRLDGVRVVIWQFAQRELLVGDWEPISLPPPPATLPATTRAATSPVVGTGSIVVKGTIRAIGRPPEPGTVPYRDCLVGVHLDGVQVVSGQSDASEMLVFIHGMQDNRLTAAARWNVGQQVELTLTPWDDAGESIHSTQQRMTDTDADFTITSWWFAKLP